MPRFEPAPCPTLPGAEEPGQGELRLPRRTGEPKLADRSHHSALGREISCELTGEATRSCRLSRWRAGRHRPTGGQRALRTAKPC